MSNSKKIQWAGIFLLLGLFTYSSIDNTFKDQNLTIAKAATENFFFESKENNFIIFPQIDLSDSNNFLKNLQGINPDQVICHINNDDLEMLSGKYSVDVNKINYEDNDLNIVEISEIQTLKDFENIMGKDNLDCRPLNKKNIFMFLFCPQIS